MGTAYTSPLTTPTTYTGSDPRKIAGNLNQDIQTQGNELMQQNQQLAGTAEGQRASTADYLNQIEDPLAQGQGGYNASESSQIELSPQDKQNIITGAGISAGGQTAAAVQDAQRAADAAGGNPLAMATYRQRAAQQQGVQAGDAMTQARIAAQQAGSAGAQAVGNARLAQQNQGLQYYQGQNQQANQNEQDALSREQQTYGTQTGGETSAAQTGVQASQTPSTLDKIVGGISSFLEEGDIEPAMRDAVVGEAGPEKIIRLPGRGHGMSPRYMQDGDITDDEYGDASAGGPGPIGTAGSGMPNFDGSTPANAPPAQQNWLQRIAGTIRGQNQTSSAQPGQSGQGQGGGQQGNQRQQQQSFNPVQPWQQLGAGVRNALPALAAFLADGGSPADDPAMPEQTGIFTRPTHVKMEPGEAAVPLSYRAGAKLRPSMAFHPAARVRVPISRMATKGPGATAYLADGGSGIHIKPSHKGLLHENLGIAKDQPIPASRLASAKKNASPALKKRIVFAENAKKWG